MTGIASAVKRISGCEGGRTACPCGCLSRFSLSGLDGAPGLRGFRAPEFPFAKFVGKEFFRSVHFSPAPLFAIPAYQKPRPVSSDPEACGAGWISIWEVESIANHHGSAFYRASDCVTEGVLKAQWQEFHADGTTSAFITALGFRGVPRSEFVSVFGW